MYKIVRSITDVITNSSSEVFIMKDGVEHFLNRSEDPDTHGCITVYPLTLEWLKWNGWAWNPVFTGICGIELDFCEYDEDSVGKFKKFVEANHDILEEKLNGLWLVDIEDHYDLDTWEEDNDNARECALYYQSFH